MGTHRLGDWLNLCYKLSLSPQRVKQIIILSFLLISFPATITFAKNTGKKAPAKLSQDSVKQSYTHRQIDGSELTKVKDANFLNSLIGRMPGATINSSASGVGGGVRMMWRGYRSVLRPNGMLFALDGIPLPQLEGEQPNDLYQGEAQTGNGMTNFSAEDIESISLLSAVEASVLYGSRAAGGVMMIRSKRGHSGKLRINLGNSIIFSSPLVMPDFQNTYKWGWGDKIVNPQPWNPADFFRTGHTINNSLSISGGNDKNQTRFSATTMNGAGLIPNNDVDRYNFSLRNTSSLLNDKLKMDISLQYIHTDERNMLSQGMYANPLVPIYLIPDLLQKNPMYPSYPYGQGVEPLTDYPYRDYYERYDPEFGANVQYWPFGDQNLFMQNPYWTINRNVFDRDKNRWLAGIGFELKLTSWLDVAARLHYDCNKETDTQKYYASSSFADPLGSYNVDLNKIAQLYSDLLLKAHKNSGVFSINATLGASLNDTRLEKTDFRTALKEVNKFELPFEDENFKPTLEYEFHDRITSLFATTQLGYKNRLYLELGGRLERAKSWEESSEKTYIDVVYPSAGFSVVPTEWFSCNNGNFLSYLKLNYTYSEAGNNASYLISPGKRKRMEQSMFYDELKPERTNSHEVGINASFFHGKLYLDFLMYRTSTSDIAFEGSEKSDHNMTEYKILRGGKMENKGIQLTLGTDMNLGQVMWNGRLTYSINKNKVKQITSTAVNPITGEDISMQELTMFEANGVYIPLKENGSVGDIYVTDFERDKQGNIMIDETLHTPSAAPGYVYAGNADPKYSFGFANNFSWKGLELDFVIHARFGGVGVSFTEAVMDAYGVSKAVAAARDNGGVWVSGQKIPAENYYWGVTNGIASPYVYDATNIRLAEMSIAYHIPVRRWVNWMQDVRVALIGRNLLMIYKKAPVDPESTASTGTWYQGIDNFRQPSCRNMGFSVNLTF